MVATRSSATTVAPATAPGAMSTVCSVELALPCETTKDTEPGAPTSPIPGIPFSVASRASSLVALGAGAGAGQHRGAELRAVLHHRVKVVVGRGAEPVAAGGPDDPEHRSVDQQVVGPAHLAGALAAEAAVHRSEAGAGLVKSNWARGHHIVPVLDGAVADRAVLRDVAGGGVEHEVVLGVVAIENAVAE
eukprot:scaffold3437_cov68-Phaeocystis_antarctica.AAC.1